MPLKKYINKLAIALLSQPKTYVKVQVSSANFDKCLANKNIAIIGGTKGIGREIAFKFASEGAKVLITGRNKQSLEEIKSILGESCETFQFDNINFEDIGPLLKTMCQYGNVDGLVLNAGVSLHEGSFINVTLDGFSQQLDTNLKSHYFFSQKYLTYLIENKLKGNLLFISSETAGKNNDLPYGLSKVAINSLVGGLSRRVISHGIRVNGIAPGVTLTDMTSKGKNVDGDIANNSPMGRYILPVEIANIACFLMSAFSSCINGEVIFADAGNHLKINGNENHYSL